MIKRQKNAVEEYKVQLQQLKEEMSMQDERDSNKEEEYKLLRKELDSVKEQKIQMQNMLQENIEEMMDLKAETEKDAKSIMELEFNLQQKEATLERVAKEVSEKSSRIAELEDEVDDRIDEVEAANEKLEESENSAYQLKRELDSVKEEVEELRCQYAAWGSSNNKNGNGAGEGGEGTEPSRSSSVASAPVSSVERQGSIFNWNKRGESAGEGSGNNRETELFEAQLKAKDATIESLDTTVKEHEETIQSLKSDMVKMSSTYKQDSYLKRKEIAKLKQLNAEYALKLRALEKAFKCVSATESIPLNGSRHGHTTHGGGRTGGLNGSSQGSLHGHSLNGTSSSPISKEEKAAAVKARLGGLPSSRAPYEFPSADQLQKSKDPQIVLESNFFDGSSDQASKDGRKGEVPEEC